MQNDLIENLPADFEEQQKLGIQILTNAYKGKVTQLEAQIRILKGQLDEKSNLLQSSQKKVAAQEVEIFEKTQQVNALIGDNRNLMDRITQMEKNQKVLETLRRTLLSPEGDSNPDQSFALYRPTDFRAVAPTTLASDPYATQMQQAGARLNDRSPINAGVTPTQSGGLAQQPRYVAEDGMDDTTSQFTAGGPGSTATNVDGKDFFRECRARLPYEAFTSFLAAIKKLNSRQINKEDALSFARDTFGIEHPDLFDRFNLLLSRSAA